MNTEQLKTAEQILLDKMLIALREDKPDWDEEYRVESCNKALNTEPLFKRCVLEAMNSFASQESKRAVDEFKGKLKVDIKYMRNITFKQDGMPVGENEDFVRGCDDILDLIDKL